MALSIATEHRALSIHLAIPSRNDSYQSQIPARLPALPQRARRLAQARELKNGAMKLEVWPDPPLKKGPPKRASWESHPSTRFEPQLFHRRRVVVSARM